MSELEKLEILKQMYVSDGSDGSEETGDDTLLAYLRLAGAKVINKAYPFRSDVTVVPDKYAMNQIEIAVFLLNKRGADGESAHSENGVSRTYEDADIPKSIMDKIVPFVKIL